MSRKVRRWLLLVVGVAAVAGLAILMRGPAEFSVPLPNPNGYDDFVEAAALLKGQPGEYQTLASGALGDLVATNAEALRWLRLGLTRICSVPTDVAVTNFPAILNDLPGQKRLALLLAAEGCLALTNGRPADATRSYLDAVRFGNEISRGGAVINRLVGLACEAIGLSGLAKVAPTLDCELQRKVIADLNQIDRSAVDWSEVIQIEKRLTRQQRLMQNPLQQLVAWWENRGSTARAEIRHKLNAASVRLLATELALRCYQSEHGSGPAGLDQLVPAELPRVPIDPFTGKPLIYRLQGTNWLLYSVGVDGIDNGGTPVARPTRSSKATGDLFYDSW